MGEIPDNLSKEHAAHSCPDCARQCKECKEKIVKMESKILKMTIALTASFTLLGQQSVEYVLKIIENTEKIVDKQEDASKSDSTKDVSYNFGGNRQGKTVNFSSHYDPLIELSGDEGDENSYFLVDTKKHNQSIENQNFNSIKWITSNHKNVVNEYDLLDGSILPENISSIYSNKYATSNFVIAENFQETNIDINYDTDQTYCTPTVMNIPSPGALCILAFGGMVHSRSRY